MYVQGTLYICSTLNKSLKILERIVWGVTTAYRGYSPCQMTDHPLTCPANRCQVCVASTGEFSKPGSDYCQYVLENTASAGNVIQQRSPSTERTSVQLTSWPTTIQHASIVITDRMWSKVPTRSCLHVVSIWYRRYRFPRKNHFYWTWHIKTAAHTYILPNKFVSLVYKNCHISI